MSELGYIVLENSIPVTLSICIPTLNRAPLLEQMLEELVRQVDSDCEFVIVDGGSSDHTHKIVDNLARSGCRVIYYRRDKPVGVDRDILKAVELASGKYCWLMSDDDGIVQGTYRYIQEKIRNCVDACGFSLNYIAYDSNLSFPIKTVPAITGMCSSGVTKFLSRDDCFTHLGQHLGFISAQVVHRDTWQEVARVRDITPFCNSWIIIYMIGEMLAINSNWYYLARSSIIYRSGNDSFLARSGVYGRQLITHENYLFIIANLFGQESVTYESVVNTLIRTRMARSLSVIKSNRASFSLQLRLLKLYLTYYRGYFWFWVKVFPIFFIPNVVFFILHRIYFRGIPFIQRLIK